MDNGKICAIVPAYREEKRIGFILEELLKSNVDEIIVVDDGSDDKTFEIAINKGVNVLRNDKNYGKGYAMDKGTRFTKASNIFFCDADLKEFTYKIINDMIHAFRKNNLDMIIATRNSHKSKGRIMLWQGQRIIKRDLWDLLPKFYKKGFRVEMGLNMFCNSYELREYKFNHVIKEKKHGIILGLYRRFFMLYHIYSAMIRFYCYDFYKVKIKS